MRLEKCLNLNLSSNIFVYRSDLRKRQTQLVYSYILMWVLPEMAKEENIIKGNSVKQNLPNQLVGRYTYLLLIAL